MMSWKKYLNRRAVVMEEMESWTEKEQDLVIFVYWLLKNIEAIDFVPFILGMVPLTLLYRGIESGLIPMFVVPAGNYNSFFAIGAAMLSYVVTAATISKFVVKKLQMKWITELYQKMAADNEVARAYEKLELIDPYPEWRIRNTLLRLDKLF
jgi:hypothetical protein